MKKIFFVVIILVLIIGAILVVGFWSVSSVAAKRDSIIDIRKNIALTETRKTNIRTLEDLLADINPQRQEAEKVFIYKKNLVDFVKELEHIAELTEVRLEIESATFSSSQKNLPSFQFKIKGDFDSVYRYFKILEVLPYQLSFDSLQMLGSGQEWKGMTRITLLSYIEKDL